MYALYVCMCYGTVLMLSLCLYVIVFSASGEMSQAFRGYKPSSVTALILEENKWNISMYVCVFDSCMYVCMYLCMYSNMHVCKF